MAIGKVVESPEDTVGMMRAKRIRDVSVWVLAAVIAAALDWKTALMFVAIAWMIRAEANLVAASVWPHCYHAMRLTMDEHGIELDGEPQIYRKSP